MAQPAGDLARPGPADILKLLAPYPGRAAMATRIALICALTAFVTSAYGTPEAAISAYVVFFLNRPDRVLSVILSSALLVLVTLMIGLVTVVAMFALDDPMWRVACITGLSFGLLFVTSASKLRPVGAILAMIVGFALDELGSVPFGEVATRALLYVWLMVAIPVGISIGVNLLIAPSPRKLVGRALAKRLRVAAQSLVEPEATADELSACLRDGDAEIGTWLKLSIVDGSSVRDDVGPLRQAVSSTLAILVAADLAVREASGRLPASFAAPVAETLENMAQMLEAGGYPIDIELKLPSGAELTPLARLVVEDLHDAITRFAVVEAQADVGGDGKTETDGRTDARTQAQTDAEGRVETAARTEVQPQAQVEVKTTPPPAAKGGGFFLPDAFTNPEHVRYALKTTVAAMFCYLLYSQINWPGIHTCFITVYMVSLGTTAETVEKMTLRIAGCLVGALLGIAAIVFVTPVLTSVAGLMTLVLVGAWLSAWIAFGSPRMAYAGFQIALVFFMCVLQGAAPGYDLTVARDRTIGILIGNVVVYLVFTRVWPVTVAARIDTGLAALRQQWERLTALPDAVTRRAPAASAMAQCGALEQDIALMHYEPSWVRPEAQWIAERRSALAKLDALEGPMFLLAERRPGDAAIEGWIKRAMDGLPMPAAETGAKVTPLPVAPDAALPEATANDDTRSALLRLSDARLTQLEHAASDDAAKGLATHAPA
ncbi:Multidrug resistance protein MdtO [Paraburkholderia aspalathi]|uniref:Multidrug resistance protein MdtO n=1 Tax=Paraburkholderia aspalathi TaxID=1324617 RepID=A0ABM8SA64_9BURK|nr:FUSC family protein [Paraburkholderia aspalathi]MBK3821257.1 FUSC family protein [Paraburkholderia aspalathi]MBK3833046.1 FUSC family protein [Paraburkholderia aspalathi]MBK3862815.1 FUSC family protein [Paraburkholderia aspalathi]CAE6797544.1 Multidrug resistance protein MdtO [Paraburkholderia aspalathi]